MKRAPSPSEPIELAERSALAVAEQEMRKLEQRLAHFTRLATAGEITAAVTHQIFQPLTAILANAQAARRFLAAPSPDVGEIEDALRDIANDVQRTAEAGRRLRGLLRRGEMERKPLDLNEVVRQVSRLLKGEAAARSIHLNVQLDPSLGPVAGDYIQL